MTAKHKVELFLAEHPEDRPVTFSPLMVAYLKQAFEDQESTIGVWRVAAQDRAKRLQAIHTVSEIPRVTISEKCADGSFYVYEI